MAIGHVWNYPRWPRGHVGLACQIWHRDMLMCRKLYTVFFVGQRKFMDAKFCMIDRRRTSFSRGDNQGICNDLECWNLGGNLEKCQENDLSLQSVYAKRYGVLEKLSFSHLAFHLVITRCLKNRIKSFFFLWWHAMDWDISKKKKGLLPQFWYHPWETRYKRANLYCKNSFSFEHENEF